MKYRLNSAEDVSIVLYHVPCTKKINGRDIVTDRNFIRLAPNTTYETDDNALIEYFRAYRRKVRYTAQLENILKEHNVPYEIELCRSCGGKVRKISYQLVEVFDA